MRDGLQAHLFRGQRGECRALTGRAEEHEPLVLGKYKVAAKMTAEDASVTTDLVIDITGQPQAQPQQQGQGNQRPQGTDQTQGQGGARVTFTTEQRTRIRETIIRSSNAPRATNVNFTISVGTAVPRTVRLVALPSLIVDVEPAWRGYMYFLVNDEIIVVEPHSLKIVAVIEV